MAGCHDNRSYTVDRPPFIVHRPLLPVSGHVNAAARLTHPYRCEILVAVFG